MFLEWNDFFMMLALFIHSVLAYVCKWHYLFVYYIYGTEETTSVKKASVVLYDIKYKWLSCENSFYHVFIIVGGIITSWIPSINIWYSPSTSEVYLNDVIPFDFIFNRFISLVRIMLLHAFNRLHACCTCVQPLIRAWFIKWWGRPKNVMLVNV